MEKNEPVMRFVVTVPMEELFDLANAEGVGEDSSAPITKESLAAALKEIIVYGLEESIGSLDGEIDVRAV